MTAKNPGAPEGRLAGCALGTFAGPLEGSIIRHTFLALLATRRLIPILLVCTPLCVAQALLSQPRGAVLLAIAMCCAFIFVAPVAWRVLFPEGLDLRHGMIRVMLYATIGAGVVLTIGAVIPKLFDIGFTLMTYRPSLVICAALFLVGGWGLARDIGFEASLTRERSRTVALAREAESAKLLALRAHLDPHFIFNTLNSIAEWCREDGEVAERAVLQLSSMLRSILNGVSMASWPLAQELELVRTLVMLYQLRDPELYRIDVRAQTEATRVMVPPLVLLPLIENAIKHGPAAGHRGDIRVEVALRGSAVGVHIENPGTYGGPRPGSTGLPILERRLRLAYGGAATLAIGSTGARTRVELSLPAAGPEHVEQASTDLDLGARIT